MGWDISLMIYGIGMDLVEIARIDESLDRFGERFEKRIFTEAERAYCSGLPRPSLNYAARFAAKEAFVKALGVGISNGISWTEIGVEKQAGGKPGLAVTGRALELANEAGVAAIHVSLSHTDTHAAAVVVLEKT